MTVSHTIGLFPHWQGFEPYRQRIELSWSRLHDETSCLASVISSNPFERFESAQSAQNPMLGYTHVSPALLKIMAGVPVEARSAYCCALLLWHMQRFEEVFTASGLHPEFRLQAIDSFHRIMDQMEAGTDWASIDRDFYMKDLGIVRLSLLAAVAQLIYPHSGIWRSAVLKGGLGAMKYVYGNCGGASSFLEIHTHDAMAGEYFNPTGWEETYRLAALALRSYPKSRGMLGTSWFYDPQLSEISPRLNYLRDVPCSRGGFLLKVGSDPSSISLATATSPTRKKLYEEGKYIPVSHSLVWSRSMLLSYYGTCDLPQAALDRAAASQRQIA